MLFGPCGMLFGQVVCFFYHYGMFFKNHKSFQFNGQKWSIPWHKKKTKVVWWGHTPYREPSCTTLDLRNRCCVVLLGTKLLEYGTTQSFGFLLFLRSNRCNALVTNVPSVCGNRTRYWCWPPFLVLWGWRYYSEGRHIKISLKLPSPFQN